MKIATNLSISLIALSMLTASAHADEPSLMGAGVRVGLFWPTDRQTRDIGGKQWTTFGIDYRIARLGSNKDGSNNSLALSLDFFQKESFRNTPILLNYVSESGQMYYFGGAGASFTKLRNNLNENENRIRPAYQIGLGYKFDFNALPTFFELKWVGSSEAKFNGWGLYAGVRF